MGDGRNVYTTTRSSLRVHIISPLEKRRFTNVTSPQTLERLTNRTLRIQQKWSHHFKSKGRCGYFYTNNGTCSFHNRKWLALFPFRVREGRKFCSLGLVVACIVHGPRWQITMHGSMERGSVNRHHAAQACSGFPNDNTPRTTPPRRRVTPAAGQARITSKLVTFGQTPFAMKRRIIL